MSRYVCTRGVDFCSKFPSIDATQCWDPTGTGNDSRSVESNPTFIHSAGVLTCFCSFELQLYS